MEDHMTYEFDVPMMDFTKAGEASSSIKKTLRQLGLGSGVIRRAAIATYEAEINVAIHSHGGKISCIISPEWVKIIAEDYGPGIEDLDKAMTQGFSTATREIRELGFGAGMGLPNMKKCSDEFELESTPGEFTRVTMTLFI